MPPRGAVELPLVIRCAGTKENALSTRLGALVGVVSDLQGERQLSLKVPSGWYQTWRLPTRMALSCSICSNICSGT